MVAYVEPLVLVGVAADSVGADFVVLDLVLMICMDCQGTEVRRYPLREEKAAVIQVPYKDCLQLLFVDTSLDLEAVGCHGYCDYRNFH